MFSIYVFGAFKDELEDIDELEFIFSSPNFIDIVSQKKLRRKDGSFIFLMRLGRIPYMGLLLRLELKIS